MATTSPDNLFSPDRDTDYDPPSVLGAMQDSVQTALVRRANAYVGTSAQRNAFTTAPVGTIWSDTNGNRFVWKRTTSGWDAVSSRTASGSVTFTGVIPNTAMSQTITFPSGLFTNAPTVILTGGTGVTTATELHFWVSGTPTTSSATISMAKGSSVNQVIHWLATGN